MTNLFVSSWFVNKGIQQERNVIKELKNESYKTFHKHITGSSYCYIHWFWHVFTHPMFVLLVIASWENLWQSQHMRTAAFSTLKYYVNVSCLRGNQKRKKQLMNQWSASECNSCSFSKKSNVYTLCFCGVKPPWASSRDDPFCLHFEEAHFVSGNEDSFNSSRFKEVLCLSCS